MKVQYYFIINMCFLSKSFPQYGLASLKYLQAYLTLIFCVIISDFQIHLSQA